MAQKYTAQQYMEPQYTAVHGAIWHNSMARGTWYSSTRHNGTWHRRLADICRECRLHAGRCTHRSMRQVHTGVQMHTEAWNRAEDT